MLLFLISLLLYLNSCATDQDGESHVFTDIMALVEQDDFFRAQNRYEEEKRNLSSAHCKVIEVFLANAFNRLGDSEKQFDFLLEHPGHIPDSLWCELYAIHMDNSLKSYRYSEAANTARAIGERYKAFLDEDEAANNKNALNLYSALADVPEQSVNIRGRTVIEMVKDSAGLDTLEINVGGITLPFLFDTGANFSTTSESVALRMGMDILGEDIEVGTVTGQTVKARLAVCEFLTLGDIDIYNSVFLVLPDEFLSFPANNYQIFGILGYPVIEGMKEITISQDGEFIVSGEPHISKNASDLATAGLDLLIDLEGKHFQLDSGADQTLLYNRYYREEKAFVDGAYRRQKVGFGGAGGKKEFDGFKIDHTFSVSGEEINLTDIVLLKDDIGKPATRYGIINQDIIGRFDRMTLNFDQMFIFFE